MKRRIQVVVAVVLTAALGSLLLPAPASAHFATRFQSKWQTEYDRSVCTLVIFFCHYEPATRDMEWWTAGGGWNSTRQARVAEAMNTWEAVPLSEYYRANFNQQSWDSSTTACSENGFNENINAFGYIDGGGNAETNIMAVERSCVTEDAAGRIWMWNSLIVYDADDSWYSGTGTPPSGTFDLRGVATHEHGHALGWGGHFLESDPVCPDPISNTSRHTMCAKFSGAAIRAMRTLESHDEHTFQEAYGGQPA